MNRKFPKEAETKSGRLARPATGVIMVLMNNDRLKRRQRNKDVDEATNRGQVKKRKSPKKKIRF